MMRRLLAPVAAVALAASLTACGGGSTGDSQESPTKVLAAAKKKLDDAKSWRMSLTTEAQPSGGNAVLAANGVGTHAPAWQGEVKVLFNGISATIPITSVDGKVHAKLPLTSSYATIDPKEYDAPDPADFMDPDTGLSSLLGELASPKETGKARSGSKIVHTYAGTLPGADVKAIIPSASSKASYETSVNVDDSGYVTSVSVTGPFFSGSGDVTYDLAFSDYDQDVKITAP